MENLINKIVGTLVRKRASDTHTHTDLIPTKIRTVGKKYPFNETFGHIYNGIKEL